MRVVAGRLRGRAILAPSKGSVRPTYDRVRESVFAMVEPRLEGAAVLDLFAGSGSLGIESLSRGAGSVTFVEKDKGVLQVTRRNAESLGLLEHCRLIRGDATSLVTGSIPGGPFDVVFVDPPYASGLVPDVLDALGSGDNLVGDAVVVVEHDSGDEFGEDFGRLTKVRSKRYGSTTVDFYETRTEGESREDQA